MKEVVVRGNHYECGFQVGKVFSRAITWRIKHHSITDREIEKHRVVFDAMTNHVRKVFPHYSSFMTPTG